MHMHTTVTGRNWRGREYECFVSWYGQIIFVYYTVILDFLMNINQMSEANNVNPLVGPCMLCMLVSVCVLVCVRLLILFMLEFVILFANDKIRKQAFHSIRFGKMTGNIFRISSSTVYLWLTEISPSTHTHTFPACMRILWVARTKKKSNEKLNSFYQKSLTACIVV